jgi:hypothetical protein
MMPFLSSSRLDMPYYGIIRSKNNSNPQLESRDIHPAHDHMTSSVIPLLMADGHWGVDTRS